MLQKEGGKKTEILTWNYLVCRPIRVSIGSFSFLEFNRSVGTLRGKQKTGKEQKENKKKSQQDKKKIIKIKERKE